MNAQITTLLERLGAEAIEITARAETCPPVPATTKVAAESRSNYATGAYNPQGIYGFTGLMAVNTWQTTCYGEVRPGYVWLMAGTYDPDAPVYNGTLKLNCQTLPPLDGSTGVPLHAQMCQILGQPTTNFIGFSANYPVSVSGNIGYNSATCNPYWFGSRTVSIDCDGTDWQRIIAETLLAWL